MSKTAPHLLRILPLQDCVSIDPAEIGERAVALVRLFQHKIPLPESYVIPVTFLQHIFEWNHFRDQFEALFKTYDPHQPATATYISEQVSYLLFDLKFPDDASGTILNDYVQWMEGNYVALRPSFITDVHNNDHLSELHVKGEANLTESLLKLWAKFYQPQYLPKRIEEWQSGQHIPAAIVIQRMVEAVSSGTAVTDEPNVQDRPVIQIFSTWGVAGGHQPDNTNMDSFEIDMSNRKIISEHISIKKHQYTHQLDSLEEQPVPFLQQAQPSLTLAQLEQLTALIAQVRHRFLTPMVLEWALEGSQFYILHIHARAIRRSHLQTPAPEGPSSPPPPASKVPVLLATEAGHPLETHVIAQVDGIGIVKSEAAWLSLDAHPLYLLHQHKAEIIKQTMVKNLLPLAQVSQTVPFIYRSQTLTSSEWSKLAHAEEYEPHEKNPQLGYRGAIKILHNYELFDLELDILSDIHAQTRRPVGVMVPFVRSASELGLLHKHLMKPQYSTAATTQLWLECDTPENILQIEQYLRFQIQGVCVNIKQLASLLIGIDPRNQDLAQLYPTDTRLLISLLKSFYHKLQQTGVQCYLYLNSWSQEYVELAAELHLQGVVVMSRDVVKTHQLLKG